MKQRIKKVILKRLLTDAQYQKINSKDVFFPGGIVPINETNDNDVFIVGFPKSGNTLMQHIITHLVYGINERASRSMVNLVVPDIYNNSHYFRFNDQCFFKSHDLPKPQYRKVIYIMRDGREALLSYYHMMKNMGTSISLEDLYYEKIKVYESTWSEHVSNWHKNPFKAEILFIKFENLKINKVSELHRICDFLNIRRSAEQLHNVVDLTSLSHMKSLEQRNDWVQIKKNKFEEGKNFVRNGKLDSFKNEVDHALIKEFEKASKEVLTRHYPNE